MKYTIYVRGQMDINAQIEVEAKSLEDAYAQAEQKAESLTLDDFDVEPLDVQEFNYSGSEPS